jgi:hypothetical protein
MHAICYNVLRGLIQQAASRAQLDVARISFKGASEQLDQWSWLFISIGEKPSRRHALMMEFYDALVQTSVFQPQGSVK